MKTLGLIGGMSWESTAIYYRTLNQNARDRLGGLSSAQLLLWSAEFASIAKLQAAGEWQKLTSIVVDAARRLEGAGADAILICANTMHKMAPEVEAAIGVPLIHIADVTADAIIERRCSRPLLLATRFVMEEDFYRTRLEAGRKIEAVIPPEADRLALHRMIFEELCQGIVGAASKAEFFRIIASAKKDEGIDGVILGCTEFGLLASQEELDIPVFDTAALHARAAMDFALNAEGGV